MQGKDVLLQIFSNPILFQKPGQQAPFFEFIERVCDASAPTIKPGCGGFGIRNFLTLFLSIEVSNFMDLKVAAEKRNDAAAAAKYAEAVAIFTAQLNDSNPVLTAMSEVMERQSVATNKLELLGGNSETSLEKEIAECEEEKERIQKLLMDIGERYKVKMGELMGRGDQ